MESEGYTAAEQRGLLLATSIGTLCTPLMSTMMNLALVHIGSEFGVGSRDLAMVNTIFLLASVAAMVPAARLASLYGMKKVFASGLIIMMVCALLAVFSPSFTFLLLMRFLLGVGSACVIVTGIAMVTYVFPLSRRGWAIGVNTTSVYLGLALGPTVGGILSDAAGWRSLFVAVIVIAGLALVGLLLFRREVVPTPGGRMDWPGAALWAATILVLMYGVINVTYVWGPVLVVIGLVLLLITSRYLARRDQPVLETKIFHNRLFSRSCIAAFMNYAVCYAGSFFQALYLQSIGDLTATEAGLLMLVQPAVQVLLTARFGALSDRLSDKRLLPTAGMAVTAAGAALFLCYGTVCSFPLVVFQMVLLGLGIALFSAPNTTVIMSSVPLELRGEASGMVAVVRQTGMMIAMGIAMACIAVIMGSTDNLGPAMYGMFVTTIRLTFAISLVLAVIGAIASWTRGGDPLADKL